VYAQNLSGTSFIVSTALTAGSTYYWDVVAKNGAGSAPASTISSFTTASGGGGTCIGGSQIFTNPGTTSWTAPANCTQAVFEVWGGGAGGSSGGGSRAGGGGGGGGYATSGTVGITAGNAYSMIVAASTGAGTDGQISHVQFSGVDVVTVTAAKSGTTTGAGGSGMHTGGTGGSPFGAGGGNGGGGAGLTDGGSGARGGAGGTGGGNGGSGGGGDGGTSCSSGSNGTAPGGGGGGGGNDGGSGCDGGAGAHGQVKVTWS
jgi:hypothetical protein